MKRNIIYTKLKKILLKYYSESWAKHLLATNSKKKPSDSMKELIEKNDGIPFEAWKNIRAWLSEQEAKQTDQKKAKK